jgi:ubiquinone/menaquinone biosynthesis C-methylase UbiE
VDEQDSIEQNRKGWDTISATYQASTRISIVDVHYGPLAPGERELGLLGDVTGKQILEVGCGGGQNAIALTRWGATCVGVDPSAAQLAHARRLAQEIGVEVRFLSGIAEDLAAFPDESFDLVLSSYAFDYVTDLRQAYREAWRVLKPGGPFVFCLSHPWFLAVGWHLAGSPDAPDIEDYAAWPAVEEWVWSFENGTAARLQSCQRKLAQIVNDLIETGFRLERLVEQHAEDLVGASPEKVARYPYIHDVDLMSQEYKIMRKLPRTLLIRACKDSAVFYRDRA